MPVSAVITILTKYQNDVRNTESKVIQHLKESTDEGDVRVNKLDAFVVAESNYVMEGQEYRAKILLAAIDTTKAPNIYVNGNKLAGNNYVATASRVGEHSYSDMLNFLIISVKFKNSISQANTMLASRQPSFQMMI